MFKKRLFISRKLEPQNDFFQTLVRMGFEVYAESLLRFEAVDFGPVPKTEWIFFYSKRAVDFFFKRAVLEDPLPRLATMGQGTGQSLQRFGLKAQFVGNGIPEQTAHQFLQEAKGQSVLFPRAQQSRKSVQSILGQSIESVDLVVYQNLPKIIVDIPAADILVFTSPMNAKTYFENYPLLAGQKIIAMGPSTASELETLGLAEVVVPEYPGLNKILELIQAI